MNKKSPPWHLFYYILAAFDLLTIGFSFSLNHKTLDIFHQSTQKNAEWVARADHYEEISRLAGKVNAPGNDVFDSHDARAESAKKKTALEEFNQKYDKSFEDIDFLQNITQKNQLKSQFAKIKESMLAMDAEAELIFSYFNRGEVKSAAQRMATMDRKYAELNHSLAALRGMVRNYQKDNLSEQALEAIQLSRYESIIAGLILLIVCIVAIYGHWLSKKIKNSDQIIKNQRISLETAERLSSLGTMSSGIAHEINNPLSVIKGNAQLVKRKLETLNYQPDAIIPCIDKIILTSERITKIITGLLMFARDGSKENFATIKVGQIFEDSVALCRERFKNNNVELRVIPPEEMAEVECRAIQICQVIINLLNNAFDAVVQSENPWVELSSAYANDSTMIFVKDSGHGIPTEIANKIMNPFFTTKKIGEGTGLGLSISHGIIQQHAGSLYVDQTSPHTLFVIKLPGRQAKNKGEKQAA